MTVTQKYRISAVGRENPFFFGDQIILQWEGSSTPWTKKPPSIELMVDQQEPLLATIEVYRPEVRLIHALVNLKGKKYNMSMAQALQSNGYSLLGAVVDTSKVNRLGQGSDEVYAAEEVGP